MPETRLFASIYIDEDIISRLAPALRQRGFEAIAAHKAGLKADDDDSMQQCNTLLGSM